MKERTFDDFLANMRANYGDRIAYRYKENDEIVCKTYNDLYYDTVGIAQYLVKNFGQENHIAIIGTTSYKLIAIYLGIVRSGNVATIIDANFNPEIVNQIIKSTDSTILFLSENYSFDASKLLDIKTFSIEDDYSDLITINYNIKYETNEDMICQLLFTSGTTTDCKIVKMQQKNILSSIYFSRADFCNQSFLSILPINHCYELYYGNLKMLYDGSTININDKIENFMQNLAVFKPTNMITVPVIMNKIADLAKYIFSQVKTDDFLELPISQRRKIMKPFYDKLGGNLHVLMVGGSVSSVDNARFLESVGMTICCGYGLTETCGCLLENGYIFKDFNTIGILSIIQNCEVKIIDGELCVKGDNVTPGYYKNDKANEESFTSDGFLKTGDLIDCVDGVYYFKGRKKNVIILDNGENVFPEQLEEQIQKIENVIECIVYENNKKICCGIYATNKSNIEEKIQEYNSTLPTYRRIQEINFTDKEFLKTITKKIRRDDAILRFNNKKEETEKIMPKTDRECEMYDYIINVIHFDDFGITDNLFEIGLDSLNAACFSADFDINLQDIYKYKTIEKLAALNKEETVFIDTDSELVNDYIKEIKQVNVGEYKSCLLTGASGFLGAFILHELKCEKVYCLVRSEKRMENNYRYYFNENLPSNVILIKGDITSKNLGIKEDIDVDIVIHCAAIVKHFGDYNLSKEINIEGTKNVAEFTKKHNACLNYISSYAISGYTLVSNDNKEKIIFDESSFFVGQHYNDNIYVKTKFLAEKYLLNEIKNGLRCNIFRLGSLTWTDEGVFQINEKDNALITRIRGTIKTNSCTKKSLQFNCDLTKVNEAADAIVKLINTNSYNNIYHIFNPNYLKFDNLNVKTISEIKNDYKDTDDYDIKLYIMYNEVLEQAYNVELKCDKTVEKLKNLGFEWSMIDKEYLSKIL